MVERCGVPSQVLAGAGQSRRRAWSHPPHGAARRCRGPLHVRHLSRRRRSPRARKSRLPGAQVEGPAALAVAAASFRPSTCASTRSHDMNIIADAGAVRGIIVRAIARSGRGACPSTASSMTGIRCVSGTVMLADLALGVGAGHVEIAKDHRFRRPKRGLEIAQDVFHRPFRRAICVQRAPAGCFRPERRCHVRRRSRRSRKRRNPGIRLRQAASIRVSEPLDVVAPVQARLGHRLADLADRAAKCMTAMGCQLG